MSPILGGVLRSWLKYVVFRVYGSACCEQFQFSTVLAAGSSNVQAQFENRKRFLLKIAPRTMSVRSFPRTRDEPRKRILLIPIVLIFGGYGLMLMHPYWSTGFIGAVISLAGVLSVFLVGMVFADLWVAARRTKESMREREKRLAETDQDLDEPFKDPFEEDVGT
ncbi:MAG: hypothetical protein DRO73_07075 [Candidatus Thorarchaeota archaeon]|nr:MAG: hypothetical protein DRO73_07075 [Candidatus Thorarchaeota archaeon]